eukprot:scaffold42593_cov54-Phaeocystis_antarctica.AAC.1
MAALVAARRVVMAAAAAAAAAASACGTRITMTNLVCMKHAPVEHVHDVGWAVVHSPCPERPLASSRLPLRTGHTIAPVLSHGLPVADSVGVTCTKLAETPSVATMSAMMRGAAIFA